jgi:hypothetical protein
MTMTDVLHRVPPVAETPGLIPVWGLIEKAHEIYFGADRWLLLDYAQPLPIAGADPTSAPRVALRFEGLVETVTTRKIDRRTAEISEVPFRRHLGPVRLCTADTLLRARLRGQAS